MLRTRPAGVVMIVVAALVSTSTAYLLATRTLEQTGPASDVQPVAALPNLTVEEHDQAVQATLLCLAAAGLVPLAEPTRSKTVTRITVDRQSVDRETAEAIIEDCGAEAELRAIGQAAPGPMLRVTSAEQEATKASLGTCLPGSVAQQHDGGRQALCLDDIIAATRLQSLAAH